MRIVLRSPSDTMRFLVCTTTFGLALAGVATAGVIVDQDRFGGSLGGWRVSSGRAAEYSISGSRYRTFKPEISPTPNGGIFVSVRIDHRRGMLASNDTASLEVTFGPDGAIESAQSVLAFQGRNIASDVIRGTSAAGTGVAGDSVDTAVKIGADLVADLTSKLLREKIVEPGRVSFPAAIRHNFNHLVAAVRIEAAPAPDETTRAPAGEDGATKPAGGDEALDEADESAPPKPAPPNPKLDIKPFQTPPPPPVKK